VADPSTASTVADVESIAGWVLYDGGCGFCSWWVPRWERTLARRSFRIASLQTPWVRERVRMDDAELLKDIRLLLADGTRLDGADVYRHVMRRIWWARPVAFFASLPGLRRLFDGGYRAFARHRLGVSRACGLPNHRLAP